MRSDLMDQCSRHDIPPPVGSRACGSLRTSPSTRPPRWCHGRPPPLRDHRARAVDGGRQAERRLPPGAPGPGGARHRPGRRRLGLGGRVLLHHLPAAARPRAGHGAHDAAPPRALGRARPRRPRPGRRRPGRRGVRAGRRPRHGHRPLRRHRAAAATRTRALRPPPTAPADRRPGRRHGSGRPPARSRPASPSRTLLRPRGRRPSSAAGPASPTGGNPIRSRSSSRSTPYRPPP